MLNKLQLASILVVAAWLVLVAWAFWWFQLRLDSSIDDYMTDKLFTIEALPLSGGGDSQITVYHFLDTECPCTKFNTDHVKSVMAAYSTDIVKFIIIVPSERNLAEAERLFPGVHYAVGSEQFLPPASPAALILSTDSIPQYIGPWSPSAVCSSHEQDYVSRVIDELLNETAFSQTHHLARGCLCPWPSAYQT